MRRPLAFVARVVLFVLAVTPASVMASGGLKIMNFNTMCSICDPKFQNAPFAERLKNIADTVRRHDPDLISFQEMATPSQVDKLVSMLGERYVALFKRHTLYPATDAAFFVRKDRFDVLESQGIWLGPHSPRFGFGWKFGIPRRFAWTRLLDRQTGLEFLLVGSHFDNSGENKEPSAAIAQEFFAKQSLPLIFAADSNLTPGHDAYLVLSRNMRNTYDETTNLVVTANAPYVPDDLCPDDAPWPSCRIDHVLLSPNAPWKVKTWGEDLFRYYKGKKFVSDHRAVVVELE